MHRCFVGGLGKRAWSGERGLLAELWIFARRICTVGNHRRNLAMDLTMTGMENADDRRHACLRVI